MALYSRPTERCFTLHRSTQEISFNSQGRWAGKGGGGGWWIVSSGFSPCRRDEEMTLSTYLRQVYRLFRDIGFLPVDCGCRSALWACWAACFALSVFITPSTAIAPHSRRTARCFTLYRSTYEVSFAGHQGEGLASRVLAGSANSTTTIRPVLPVSSTSSIDSSTLHRRTRVRGRLSAFLDLAPTLWLAGHARRQCFEHSFLSINAAHYQCAAIASHDGTLQE